MSERNLNILDVFNPLFDAENALRLTEEDGYYFESGVITPKMCRGMEREATGMDLQIDDRVKNPINKGEPNEVTQMLTRGYYAVESPEVPLANMLSEAITIKVRNVARTAFSELAEWAPSEAGYQKYRGSQDHLGAHRDRATDQLLAFTVTVSGSSRVLIREPLGDPSDYKNTKIVDAFRTSPGSVMFLRAPGFGNGEQVIHEALPPETGNRLILNLRMQSNVLSRP